MGELKKLSKTRKIDTHKPGIDAIVIKKNGKEFKRVPEVLDVWFDSGVSSWAALGYPSEKGKLKKYWPADLNIEGKDQFRGWWNSQMILGEIEFGKKPFDSVLVHGMILDIDKRKMSKSKGNIISPREVIEKFGRDFLRYYFTKFSKGEDFSYDEKEFGEIRKVLTILINVNNFVNQLEKRRGVEEIEDKWILSRYNDLVRGVIEDYNSYKFPEAVQKLEAFLTNDLSRKYIQIVREREGEVYGVLDEIRNGLIKLYAPVIPFLSEKIWQELREKKIVKEESVHLSSFPSANLKKIDRKLEEEFEVAKEVIEVGLAERDKAGIGLRWPLSKAVYDAHRKLSKDVEGVIERQLNVKKLIRGNIKENANVKVKLDTTITKELEAEGFAREFARKIQAERKNFGLKKGDLIHLKISVDSELKYMLQKHLSFIQDRTNSRRIDFVDDKISGKAIEFEIKGKKIFVLFS